MNQNQTPQRRTDKWHRRRLWLIYLRKTRMTPKTSAMLIGAMAGVLAGIGAWFLKWSIGGLSRFFLSLADPSSPNWYLFALPFVGIMATACYQRYVLKYSVEHGIAQVSHDVAMHQYKLRTGFCFQPIIANVMTVGLGGSAGAEGPIATVGAAIGSVVSRFFGMSPDQVRMLIGCGAGAGIAGIFKAPLGGALFTIEVLKMKLDTVAALVLFVATINAALTTYILTGFTFNIEMPDFGSFDMTLLGWALALGVFCGFYSLYYNKVTNIMLRKYNNMKNHWVRNLSSATIVGICLIMFPAMYGEGYISVTKLLNGHYDNILAGGLFAGFDQDLSMMLIFGALLIIVKALATVSSNSGGGVGGDFAPTIFAGAFAGLVFSWAMNLWFDAGLSPSMFVFLGTAGAFAGIINAPIMATFLVVEMVGFGFIYILPVALVAFASFFTVKLFSLLDRDSGENKAISPHLHQVNQ